MRSLLIVILLIGIAKCQSSYLELGDNFSEIRKNGGYWLIKFYAPWCGHCQRLEPVWNEVGEALIHTNVRVGRIDCSHFPRVASEFDIRGYPTIKFITKDSDHTFTGDRTKDEIIQFAARVVGPPVKIISSISDFNEAKKSTPLFFAFIGERNGEFWNVFYDVAKRFQQFSYFYAVNKDVAENILDSGEYPSLMVFKENEATYFQSSDNIPLNTSMIKWVNEERFGTYLKVSRGNLNDLMQLNRYVVLAIVDEKKLHEDSSMKNFRDMVGNIIKNNKRKYRKRFIFGWVGNPDFANSIALDVVPLPYLLVINSTNHYHHVPETEDCSKMTTHDVEAFLESIYNQSACAYGGNGFGTRLYRAYFEAKTAFSDMWQASPVLTAILFVIPVLFIIFIFYSLCFADVVDTDCIEDDEEEEEYERDVLLDNDHPKSE